MIKIIGTIMIGLLVIAFLFAGYLGGAFDFNKIAENTKELVRFRDEHQACLSLPTCDKYDCIINRGEEYKPSYLADIVTLKKEYCGEE